MLKRTLAMSFWTAYDALGTLVIANLLWLALTAPFVGLLFLAGLPIYRSMPYVFYLCAPAVLLLNPASAGLAEMTQRLADGGEAPVALFWRGVKQHFFRALFLMSGAVLATMILSASVLFYTRGVFESLGRFGNTTAAGLSLWALVILAGMTCYWMPVAMAVPGRKPRLWTIVRRAALLTVDNPAYTLGVLLVTVVMAVFWAGTGVGLAVIGVSAIRAFHSHARRVLHERYETAAALSGRGRPSDRRSVREALLEEWASEPRRSLRELIRPWDA
ncbi:DUF624 domain-containing protein [Candidatus Poribacteria bacterium]|nr:DUF624 domain-containing protein [Candidatus Poribacteria bacterium]MBT5534439.1 DUF624 domain-containing protein [Candidatus Poribacteria bacterium]MBT5709467.1 DUF624 domain-containing protein [Candidatus Poribacteria bacterium]MBT7099310.1 DUF624 domain-containing protein [Candidatus Poribacteria bacterium]MBT7809498.1 DUF624 domain-containing protein [Candidatus Poribacteria bacterium]